MMSTDRSLLRSIFPDRTVDSISVSNAGNSKRTIAVWFEAHDPVVLQCSSVDSLRTEGQLARAIRKRTTVPVPKVIGMGSVKDTSYVISELASGENLHSLFAGLDRSVQQKITRSFGRYLAELHGVFTFERFGEVVSTGTDLPSYRATGPRELGTWFRQYALEGIEALPGPFDPLRENLREAVNSCTIPKSPTPVLYPWDLRPGNALIEDGSLSAVLDWGDPLAGPAGLAAAKVCYLTTDWYVADADPLRTAFRNGYASVREYPPIPPIHRLVAVLRSAVDSSGVVTRPRYPEWTGDQAVAFHTTRLEELLMEVLPA